MPADNTKTAQQIVDYIGYADAALTKAAAVIQERDEQATKLAALIPAAVAACVEHERIEPHQKEAMAAALADPVQAMELVIKLAAHRNGAELARIGTPVGTAKSASHDPSKSLTSGMVGARTDALRASDVKLFEALGLPVPTT